LAGKNNGLAHGLHGQTTQSRVKRPLITSAVDPMARHRRRLTQMSYWHRSKSDRRQRRRYSVISQPSSLAVTTHQVPQTTCQSKRSTPVTKYNDGCKISLNCKFTFQLHNLYCKTISIKQ